jgi:DNA-binding transcriptional regulator YiaG
VNDPMNSLFRELFIRAKLMGRHEYRAIRKSVGSQKAVAARLQISRTTIQRRESGRRAITTEAAIALLSLTPASRLPPPGQG